MPPPRHLALRRSPALVMLASGAAAVLGLALLLPDVTASRWVLAFAIACTLLVVVLADWDHGLVAVSGFLLALGLARRLTSTVLPDPSDDPLLLVGPSLAAAMCVIAIGRGGLRQRSALSVMTIAFVAVSVAAVANVSASSISANVNGLLFWTVPLLWFPVGRLIADEATLRRLLRFVAVIGTGACAVGLYQVLVDLPPWDQTWFDTRGYVALGILGFETLHPWGWSPSHTEFSQLAALVMVVSGLELIDARRIRSARNAALAAVGLAVAGGALAVSGVRTAQLTAVLAIGVVVMASGRVRPVHFVFGVVISVLLLVGGVHVLDVENWDTQGASSLMRRSLLGITQPFDPGESTIRAHLTLTRDALEDLPSHPLGSGTAVGTIARGDNDAVPYGAENDLGSAAAAFGFAGLGLVVGITAVGLHHAWQRARTRPEVVPLAALGLLVLSLRYWWTGAHYATAMLVWLTLGFTDRPNRP